ncbi:MAG: peptidoglycan D,D-transpeptidase FtsI family protein, partial [Acidimicrobiia bacterium]
AGRPRRGASPPPRARRRAGAPPAALTPAAAARRRARPPVAAGIPRAAAARRRRPRPEPWPVGRRSPRGRLAVALAGMLAMFLLLSARVVQVQGLEADRYSAFGESQRVRNVALPAERGSIFDRNGRDLALSVRQSTVTADPRLVTDPLAAAAALSPVLGLDPVVLQKRLTREASFVYLARRVDDAVAEQVKALALPGVSLVDEPERFRPAGDLALPVIGRVGTEHTGLSGLESQYERRLAGKPGRMIVERDPRGGDIPGGVRRFDPAARGDDLVLTLDRALQYETERALAARLVSSGAKAGTAVVMQARTGEVLALANLAAGDDGGPPRQAGKNLAVTDVFEPGSVNKVITISAALEEGEVRAQDVLEVPPTIKVADHVFKEHEPHPLARWSITDIMANSSNVGSIMVGQRLGKDRIDRYLRAFGFGRETGLGFPGESAGILLDPRKWSGTSIGTVPIGQGVAVTAMQMAGAYNAVANGGTWVAPSLVRATVDAEGRRQPPPPRRREQVVSARTAQQVTAMLSEVVRVGTGTLAAVDGYTVAGKTGTARKPKEGARGYAEGAYVSSFAGFVPAERPELTIVVVLDEPTPIFGGLVAAPVFSEIAGYALRQFQVPPPPPDAAPPAAAEVPRSTPESAGEAARDGGAVAATSTTTLPPSSPPTP